MEKGLSLENMNKSFGDLIVFDSFNISFSQGKINCILGPSGCGKTTLLNIISGTTLPDNFPSNDFRGRKISYVFQEPRLLPWRTALENLVFALKDTLPKQQLYPHALEYLKLVELEKFQDYYPSKLSGGMKQRLSLARAFSFPSEIILMDEPFKALDLKLKSNLMRRFRNLWEKDRRTVIYVTHDVDEAIQLGSSIQVLEGPPVNIIRKYRMEEENKEDVRKEILQTVYSE
jgi:NitT/TauT family transport system ATP-binding protein